MRRLFLTLVITLSVTASSVMAADFSSVEEQMSAREFKEAGLDKLSAEELAALNSWIKNKRPVASNTQAYDRVSDDKVRVGFNDSDNRDAVVSNIVGEFKGWGGGTTFTLENGQVWQQSESGELVGIKVMNNPKVTIRPAIIGNNWKLQVEGYNSTVRVKRIK